MPLVIARTVRIASDLLIICMELFPIYISRFYLPNLLTAETYHPSNPVLCWVNPIA